MIKITKPFKSYTVSGIPTHSLWLSNKRFMVLNAAQRDIFAGPLMETRLLSVVSHCDVFFPSFSQVEKTKHYLLLREKLESTLLMGQESLLSCVTEELSESPQPPDADQEVSSSSEITTERQRELAAKVSHHY